MLRRYLPILAVLIVAGVAAAFLWRYVDGERPVPPPEPPPVTQLYGKTMGGDWSVKLAEPMDGRWAIVRQRDIESLLQTIEKKLSAWDPRSDLSEWNRVRRKSNVAASDELKSVVTTGLTVSNETDGAFDLTIEPLVVLWGFGPSAATRPADWKPPTDDAIAAARAHVGYRRVERPHPVYGITKLEADVTLDVNGIVPGYAVDRVVEYLDRAEVKNYLVNIGGETFARGEFAPGRPWRIGIQEPTPDTRRVIRGLVLRDLAVAPSGDYANFFTDADGKRYSHIIDPRTGRPIEHRLASVAVVHPSAAYADAMSTALMVLGPDDGFAFAEKRGLAVVFIVRKEGAEGQAASPNAFEVKVTRAAEAIVVVPQGR